MPSTYTLIKGETLASSAASYTFTAIPSTYTDLVLRVSSRVDVAGIADFVNIIFSSDSGSKYSRTFLAGDGSSATSGRNSANTVGGRFYSNATSTTSNTFSTTEIYIPAYLVSQNKPYSIITMSETNATAADMLAVASLFSSTAAITSIALTPASGNFVTGSSFYLYGIKNS
jgi:hypothetical protein